MVTRGEQPTQFPQRETLAKHRRWWKAVTKQELEKLVRELYGIYNKDLFEVDAPHVFRGWYHIIGDDNVDKVRDIIRVLVLEYRYLFSAGVLQLAYIKTQQKSPPPTPHEFWGFVCDRVKQVAAGTFMADNSIGDHPVVQSTLRELSGSLLGLVSNGDRTFALECYQRHCAVYREDV